LVMASNGGSHGLVSAVLELSVAVKTPEALVLRRPATTCCSCRCY